MPAAAALSEYAASAPYVAARGACALSTRWAPGKVGAVIRAAYWDADHGRKVEVEERGLSLPALLSAVLGRRSDRGCPALELTSESGACLTLGTDGVRAVLVWIDSLGEPFMSVGRDEDGQVLIYDYMGSWSEAPADALVPLADAVACAQAFFATGSPDTARVLFAPT
jgi:Immunity protein Imm1